MRDARYETGSFCSTLLRISFAAIFWCFLLMLPCLPSSAAVIYVPGGYPTIQEAIDTAVDGDEIIVSPGLYLEHINFNGKNIILRSADPTDPDVVETTIIDGGKSGHAVTFSGAESPDCVLSGFTITNGYGGYGGGVYGNETLATIRNNIVSGNEAIWYGGGLHKCNGIVESNSITGNLAGGYGGGLAWCNGTIQSNIISDNVVTGGDGGGLAWCNGTILDNTVSDNEATSGGGLYRCSGTIQNNSISNNSASSYGGGLMFCDGDIDDNTISRNSGSAGGGLRNCNGMIQNNTISDNSADSGGGLDNCGADIIDNIISNNTAEFNGGGLGYCGGTIENNTISDNSADQWGGGVAGCDGIIENNTIVGNRADLGGGLCFCDGAIQSNLISDNEAGVGGGLMDCDGIIENNFILGNSATGNGVRGDGGGFNQCDGTIQNNTIYGNSAADDGGGLYWCRGTVRNCIIWQNTAFSGGQLDPDSSTPSYSCIQDWTGGGTENISDDPLLLDPVGGDFRLHPDSPCVDAGRYVADLTEDFEGDPRGYDGTPEPRGDGMDFDIGADEYVPTGPVAEFSAAPTSGSIPLTVQFTDLSAGEITSWWWSFGDGTTSTEQNPSHVYNTTGSFTVSLTVNGPEGSDTETKTEYINVTEPAPVAGFTGTPTSGNRPLEVQFTDQSTGEITSWSWSFGDGGTSVAQNPSHTYNSTGYFTVSLTVTGPGGSDTETKTDYIHVTEAAPVAAFSAIPISGHRPLTVEFADESTGEVTSWLWNFGDGGTSTQQNPSHTYNTAGYFTVSLTVSGPGGSDTETKTNYIHVTETAPVAGFSASPRSGSTPLEVEFADESTGTVTSWSWDFGDGGTSTARHPSHTYNSIGYFTVRLTVSGPGGSDTETKASYIHVTEAAAVADFTASPASGALPLTVRFTDQSTGTVTSWSWSFGDGATSTAQNPSHTYTSAGHFTVSLVVTGPGGSDTETKTNYIRVWSKEDVDQDGDVDEDDAQMILEVAVGLSSHTGCDLNGDHVVNAMDAIICLKAAD